MGGYIMQLQNYSVNDGEGIRTNVFLAGCPLRCLWCSNPEGQTIRNPMTRYMETEEIIEQVKKQMIFYRNSGGGVTFSGGEATVQAEFLRELAGAFYDMGISIALETCGYLNYEEVEDIFKKMDLIFYDLKHMDEERHRHFTGVSNEKILSNASKVVGLHIPMVIRIPAIHGVNTDDKNIMETLKFIRHELNGAKLEFLPYHTLGEGKYKELGMKLPPKEFARPKDEEIEHWAQIARDMGIQVVSYK